MRSLAIGAQESKFEHTRSPEAYSSKLQVGDVSDETKAQVRVDTATTRRDQTSPQENGSHFLHSQSHDPIYQVLSNQPVSDELQSKSNIAISATTIPMTIPPAASSADNSRERAAEKTTTTTTTTTSTTRSSERRHKSRVLDPSGALYHHWSMVVSLAFLYNFWSLSYRFAFQEIDFDTVVVWFALDYSADFIYVLDVVMNFHTGYLEDGVLQRNVDKISVHYRECTQFYLDCFCLLPLDILYLSIGFNSVLRCTRLVKIYKFWSYVERAERHTNYPNIFRTFTLVHYILVIFHWNACIFHMISKNKLIDIENLYKINDNRCDDILCQYLKAFYWSTLALTTVGDLPRPRTKGEYIYVTVELFFGLFLFASVLGYVANIVTNVSAARKEFQAKLDAVKTFMRMRRVSDELQSKVIRWFDYLWISQQSSDEDRSVACLPDRLKAEIAIHVHLDTLKRVDIFQNTEAGFLCELVLRLKPVLFSPGDYVCRKNEVGHEMYIVSRGILEVVTNEGRTVVATLKAGSYFGEISMLNVGPAGNRRTASVRSVGYSDLFCLNKQDLWDVLKNYPNAEARIRARAEERLSKLSDPNKSRNADNNETCGLAAPLASTMASQQPQPPPPTTAGFAMANPLSLNGRALAMSQYQHSMDANRPYMGANAADGDKRGDSHTGSLVGSTNLRQQSSGLTSGGAHRRRVCSSSSCSKPIAAKLIAAQRISQLHSNSNLEIDPPNLAKIARDSRRSKSHRVSSTRRCMGCNARLDCDWSLSKQRLTSAKLNSRDRELDEVDDRKLSAVTVPTSYSSASDHSSRSDYDEDDNLLPGCQRCLPVKSRSDCFGLRSQKPQRKEASCACTRSGDSHKLSFRRQRLVSRPINSRQPAFTSMARRNQVHIDHDEADSIRCTSPVIHSKSFETTRNQPSHSPSYIGARQSSDHRLLGAESSTLLDPNDRGRHRQHQRSGSFSIRSVDSTLGAYLKRNKHSYVDQVLPRTTLDEYPISRLDEVNGPNLPLLRQQISQTGSVPEATSSSATGSQVHLRSEQRLLQAQSQHLSCTDPSVYDTDKVTLHQRQLYDSSSLGEPLPKSSIVQSNSRYGQLVPGDRPPMGGQPIDVPSHVQIPVQVSVAQPNGQFLQVPIAISTGSNVMPVRTTEATSAGDSSVIHSRSMSHLTPIQVFTALPPNSNQSLLSDRPQQMLLQGQQQYLIVTTGRQSDLNLSTVDKASELSGTPENLTGSSMQATLPRRNQSHQQQTSTMSVCLPIESASMNTLRVPQYSGLAVDQNIATNVSTSEDLHAVDQSSAVEQVPQRDSTECHVYDSKQASTLQTEPNTNETDAGTGSEPR